MPRFCAIAVIFDMCYRRAADDNVARTADDKIPLLANQYFRQQVTYMAFWGAFCDLARSHL
jgi:hypothetical protein